MVKRLMCPGVLLAAWLCIAILFSSSAQAASAASPEQVDNAIKKGVAYLYSKQKVTGQWETDLRRKGTGHDWTEMQGDAFGGYTALCVFALLEAGEKPSDPRLMKAIAFLKTCDMVGVYSLGL